MRLIDADEFIETAWKKLDMNDSFLPVDIKEHVLDKMPTVDAEPVRHGHIEADGYTYTCSVCESRLFEHDLFWRYCPYCGARLEDEEECENT